MQKWLTSAEHERANRANFFISSRLLASSASNVAELRLAHLYSYQKVPPNLNLVCHQISTSSYYNARR